MARKVFYTFHYDLDNQRVQQVKNMGVIEGQPLLSSNKWEEVEDQGEAAIQKWIDDNMVGKSCNVVLIGSKTAGRKWVQYEFKKAWGDGKGVLGVHIHNLKDLNENQAAKGKNPFAGFTIKNTSGQTVAFDTVVPVYDPPYSTSKYVYDHIKSNLADWVENAITVRNNWSK